jgi:lipopolysaccharide biosynthesis regulator YciM
MRMGNVWFDKGEIRQAIDVYLKVLDEYPGTEESITAQYVLLNIAQRYQHEGLFRLSLDVLERLEQTQVNIT